MSNDNLDALNELEEQSKKEEQEKNPFGRKRRNPAQNLANRGKEAVKHPGPKRKLEDAKARTYHIEQKDLDRLFEYCYENRIPQNEFVREAIKEKLDKETM